MSEDGALLNLNLDLSLLQTLRPRWTAFLSIRLEMKSAQHAVKR